MLNIANRFLEALDFFPIVKNSRTWDLNSSIEVAKIARTLNPPKSQKNIKTLEETIILLREIYE